MSLPPSMRMAVRPTRLAWASLWLTQIMALAALSDSHWSISCSTAVEVGAVQRGGRLVEQEDLGVELQGTDQGRDLDLAAGKLRNLLFQEGRLAPQGG